MVKIHYREIRWTISLQSKRVNLKKEYLAVKSRILCSIKLMINKIKVDPQKFKTGTQVIIKIIMKTLFWMTSQMRRRISLINRQKKLTLMKLRPVLLMRGHPSIKIVSKCREMNLTYSSETRTKYLNPALRKEWMMSRWSKIFDSCKEGRMLLIIYLTTNFIQIIDDRL